MACYDTGGGVFFSTCGAYGVCQDIDPPCVDPKSVTTRVDHIFINANVTGTWCHTDHWYPWDPYAPARYYDYTIYTYRHDTVQITELCNGSVSEQVISSNYTSTSCAQRTWFTCYSSFGPPPLTCA